MIDLDCMFVLQVFRIKMLLESREHGRLCFALLSCKSKELEAPGTGSNLTFIPVTITPEVLAASSCRVGTNLEVSGKLRVLSLNDILWKDSASTQSAKSKISN